MDSPNSLGYVTSSCPNGISDTLRPLPSEWTYPNVAGKPIPCFRDAVMLKSACRYAFVGISGRSYRPRVFIGFSSLWPRVDAGSNPAEGTDKSISKGATMEETLQEIAHQLTRIADQGEQAGMQISRGDALEAWGLRIYEDDFLSALTRLGIEVTD